MRLLGAICLLAVAPLLAQEPVNLLRNPSFEDGFEADGSRPKGWALYGGTGPNRRVAAATSAHEGQVAVLLSDGDPAAEIGITQTVAAEPGKVYRAEVWVTCAPGKSAAGSYLQMRFLPSQVYRQVSLNAAPGVWRRIRCTGEAPADTKQIIVYLYSHRDPTPEYTVDAAGLFGGVELEEDAVPNPVPPPIERLKDLHRTTPLVADGQPQAAIVVPAAGRYQAAAQRLQAAVRELTGATLPIVDDTSPAAAVPLVGHLICLGNRSTNRTISRLYDQHYTVLDLKWPGPGGHAVRSLHSPFGDGRNVLFAGGSDDAGVAAATDALIAELRRAGGGPGRLAVGWLMITKLSPAYRVPTELKDVAIWDASDGYGSSGYFGWNSISKRLALYHLTGDRVHAREALRLAFPDEATKQELAATDGEMIENKDAPLSGPYHYNAHFMVLYWDLVEESDVFTDAERLRVTQAFAQQLLHRKDEGIYNLAEPSAALGSRHGQWSAISLYCLGRYLQAGYPHRVWAQCVRGAVNHFSSLHTSAWVAGESDNLFWFNTGTAPILQYLVLTGDRVPVQNGTLGVLLRAQEALISGRVPDWALRSGALTYFHQCAYVTGDGRWLTYRDRGGQDLSGFRLGQSFWPDDPLRPQPPTDLVNRWNVYPLAELHWAARNNGLPLAESFNFASYRSAPDAGGDFLLLDGFNGASRNPYHCFAILELRIGGRTILQSSGGAYLNQVQTKADGLVEPRVAMDAALRRTGVLGQTAYAVAEVPKLSYANWRRTIAQRVGRYALVADDLTFKTASANLEAKTLWQPGSGFWDAKEQAVKVTVGESPPLPAGWQRFAAADAPLRSEPGGEKDLVTVSPYRLKLLRATAPGHWLEQSFRLAQPFAGEVYAELLDYNDRGIVGFQLDGQPVGPRHDHWSSGIRLSRVNLGQQQLAAGEHRLRLEVVGRHEALPQTYLGLLAVLLRPAGAAASDLGAMTCEIRPCDVLPATVSGGVATLTWTGEAKQGDHRYDFTLLAPSGASADQALACVRLAPNAAALRLPEPALAVAGESGSCRGDLVVLSAGHLFGVGVRSAGLAAPLLTASTPVDVDWDLAGGALEVTAAAPTRLNLAVGLPADGLLVNGQRVDAEETAAGDLALDLPAGTHAIRRAKPTGSLAADLAARVEGALATRAQQLAKPAAPTWPGAPLATAWTATLGGKPAALATTGDGPTALCFVAAGQTIHAVDPQGTIVRTFAADAPIRVLHWWAAPGLLLAGCVDEQVIAFEPTGARRWTYTSVMDPAVFRAAKQYWFKSAPGHEGIHGLGSGAFIDGRENLFVGSACTLEILDPAGGLLKRLPVFWGPGTILRTIDGPQGSRNLLVARWPNDGAALAVINSRALDPNPRSFLGVPSGHDFVGGWACQNRNHLFYGDVDGDGAKEVASEINGTWNRLTVWGANGEAKASANFGPGPAAGAKTVRAVDMVDLNGDQRPEFLCALADGLVVALDGRCERLWSTRLPSPPTVLTAVAGSPGALLGAEDGQVALLDGQGAITASAKLAGRPALAQRWGPRRVLVATEAGGLVAIDVP